MFLYYFAPTEELKTDADAPEALALRALHWTTLTAGGNAWDPKGQSTVGWSTEGCIQKVLLPLQSTRIETERDSKGTILTCTGY